MSLSENLTRAATIEYRKRLRAITRAQTLSLPDPNITIIQRRDAGILTDADIDRMTRQYAFSTYGNLSRMFAPSIDLAKAEDDEIMSLDDLDEALSTTDLSESQIAETEAHIAFLESQIQALNVQIENSIRTRSELTAELQVIRSKWRTPEEMKGDYELKDYLNFRHGDQRAVRANGEEFDAIDGKVLYRGVGHKNHAQSDVDGEHTGYGVYGNGNYFAYDDKFVGGSNGVHTALDYAQGEDGWIYTTKLHPDARVIDHWDLGERFLQAQKNYKPPASIEPGIALSSDGVPLDDAETPWHLSDVGRFAADQGYDAINVPNNGYMVVLNQKKVVVDERTLPGGEFDSVKEDPRRRNLKNKLESLREKQYAAVDANNMDEVERIGAEMLSVHEEMSTLPLSANKAHLETIYKEKHKGSSQKKLKTDKLPESVALRSGSDEGSLRRRARYERKEEQDNMREAQERLREQIRPRGPQAPTRKTSQELNDFLEDIEENPRHSTWGDTQLEDYLKFRYGNQRAQRVSGEEFDKLQSKVLYRGVNSEGNAQKLVNGTGIGKGMFGNGHYFAADDDQRLGVAKSGAKIAHEYAEENNNSWIYTGKLAPDTNIITHDEISSLHSEWFFSDDPYTGDDDEFKPGNKVQAQKMSLWAAHQGYDAIEVETLGYVVVLNQQKLIVDERSLPDGEFSKNLPRKMTAEAAQKLREELAVLQRRRQELLARIFALHYEDPDREPLQEEMNDILNATQEIQGDLHRRIGGNFGTLKMQNLVSNLQKAYPYQGDTELPMVPPAQPRAPQAPSRETAGRIRRRFLELATADEDSLAELDEAIKAQGYVSISSGITDEERRASVRKELDLMGERRRRQRDRTNRALSLLESVDEEEMPTVYISGATPDEEKQIRKGIKQFVRMTGRWPNKKAEIRIQMTDDRSIAEDAYDGTGSTNLFIDRTKQKETMIGEVIHEMGHALERANPEILRKNAQFLHRRTMGDKRMPMKVLKKDIVYRDTEEGWADEFVDPYMGMDYRFPKSGLTGGVYVDDPRGTNMGVYGTEITSMGLELMLEDPVKFAKEDPDYFDFMVENVLNLEDENDLEPNTPRRRVPKPPPLEIDRRPEVTVEDMEDPEFALLASLPPAALRRSLEDDIRAKEFWENEIATKGINPQRQRQLDLFNNRIRQTNTLISRPPVIHTTERKLTPEEIKRGRNRLRGLRGSLTKKKKRLAEALESQDKKRAEVLTTEIANLERGIDELARSLPERKKKPKKRHRKPDPVHPRTSDGALYDADMQQKVIDPIHKQLRAGLAEAKGAAEAFDVLKKRPKMPVNDEELAAEIKPHFDRINNYHRAAIIDTFRRATGISVIPLLKEGPIQHALHERVRGNVALIKTIPRRLHASVYSKLTNALKTDPFNRQMLEGILTDEFKKSAGRARLIARDQTNKAVGQFTQLRHEQIGIQKYEWSSSGDQRVRPTHQANDGKIFSYDKPPAKTGHPGWDIQCRCVAIPVFEDLPDEEPESLEESAYHAMSPKQRVRALHSEQLGLNLWQRLKQRPGQDDAYVQRHIEESKTRIATLQALIPPSPRARPDEPYVGIDLTADDFKYSIDTSGPFSPWKTHTDLPDYVPEHLLSESVQNYIINSKSINEAMRTGREHGFADAISEMRADMKPISQNIFTYRGRKTDPDLEVGDVWSDKGFMSTSMDPGLAGEFTFVDAGTILMFRLPSGQKAIVTNAEEQEIILDRKTQWKVIDSRKNIQIQGQYEDDEYEYKAENFYMLEPVHKPPPPRSRALPAHRGHDLRDTPFDESLFGPEAFAEHKRLPEYQEYTEVRKGTKDYMISGYHKVNAYLRGKAPLYKIEAERIQKDLMADMRPLEDPLIVHRGIDRKFLKQNGHDLRPGDTWGDKAFMSTSTTPDTAEIFHGGAMLQIELPRGQQSIVTNAAEQEVILPPDMVFKVKERHVKGENPGVAVPAREFYILEAVPKEDQIRPPSPRAPVREPNSLRTKDELNAKITEIVNAPDSGEWGDPKFMDYLRYRHGEQKAQVVDGNTFDSIEGPTMFRGVDHTEHVHDAIQGKVIGKGVYGNGNYFAHGNNDVQRRRAFNEAVGYMDQTTGNAWVFPAKLAPDARVAKESVVMRALYGDPDINAQTDEGKFLLYDQGHFAAHMGYDAIEITEENYIVVLNQRKLIVDERALPGGEFDQINPDKRTLTALKGQMNTLTKERIGYLNTNDVEGYERTDQAYIDLQERLRQLEFEIERKTRELHALLQDQYVFKDDEDEAERPAPARAPVRKPENAIPVPVNAHEARGYNLVGDGLFYDPDYNDANFDDPGVELGRRGRGGKRHQKLKEFREMAALSPEARQYIGSNTYKDINWILREGRIPTEEEVQKFHLENNRPEGMSREDWFERCKSSAEGMMDDFRPLKADLHVYRVDPRPETRKLQEGDFYGDGGFLSTSTDPEHTMVFRQSINPTNLVYTQVVLPEGQNAIVTNPWESEVVLPPNTTFRVKKRYEDVELGFAEPKGRTYTPGRTRLYEGGTFLVLEAVTDEDSSVNPLHPPSDKQHVPLEFDDDDIPANFLKYRNARSYGRDFEEIPDRIKEKESYVARAEAYVPYAEQEVRDRIRNVEVYEQRLKDFNETKRAKFIEDRTKLEEKQRKLREKAKAEDTTAYNMQIFELDGEINDINLEIEGYELNVRYAHEDLKQAKENEQEAKNALANAEREVVRLRAKREELEQNLIDAINKLPDHRRARFAAAYPSLSGDKVKKAFTVTATANQRGYKHITVSHTATVTKNGVTATATAEGTGTHSVFVNKSVTITDSSRRKASERAQTQANLQALMEANRIAEVEARKVAEAKARETAEYQANLEIDKKSKSKEEIIADRAKTDPDYRELLNQRNSLDRQIKTRLKRLKAANKAGRKRAAKTIRAELRTLRTQIRHLDWRLDPENDLSPDNPLEFRPRGTFSPRAGLPPVETVADKKKRLRSAQGKLKTRKKYLTAANKAGRKKRAKELRREMKTLRSEIAQLEEDLAAPTPVTATEPITPETLEEKLRIKREMVEEDRRKLNDAIDAGDESAQVLIYNKVKAGERAIENLEAEIRGRELDLIEPVPNVMLPVKPRPIDRTDPHGVAFDTMYNEADNEIDLEAYEALYDLDFGAAPDYQDEFDLSGGSKRYITSFYKSINDQMKSGKIDGTHRQWINEINDDMQPLENNYLVYRGIAEDIKLEEGDGFSSKAFSSTSTDIFTAAKFAREKRSHQIESVIHVELPKGQKALVTNSREREVVLPADTKLRVKKKLRNIKLDDEIINNFYVMEVIEDAGRPPAPRARARPPAPRQQPISGIGSAESRLRNKKESVAYNEKKLAEALRGGNEIQAEILQNKIDDLQISIGELEAEARRERQAEEKIETMPRVLEPVKPVPINRNLARGANFYESFDEANRTFSPPENDHGQKARTRFKRTLDYREPAELSKATKDYLDHGYDQLNRMMRTNRATAPRTQRIIADIQGDMRPLKGDTFTYRGDKRKIDFLKPGDSFTSKSFLSTSADPDTSAGFGDISGRAGQKRGDVGTVFSIELPKGQRAIVTNAMEAEVLLPPDVKFRVKERHDDVTMQTGKGRKNVAHFYVMEVVEKSGESIETTIAAPPAAETPQSKQRTLAARKRMLKTRQARLKAANKAGRKRSAKTIRAEMKDLRAEITQLEEELAPPPAPAPEPPKPEKQPVDPDAIDIMGQLEDSRGKTYIDTDILRELVNPERHEQRDGYQDFTTMKEPAQKYFKPGPGHRQINATLRGQNVDAIFRAKNISEDKKMPDNEVQEAIEELTNAMTPTNKEVIVYRGVPRGVYLQEGDEFTEEAFSSTTFAPRHAKLFADEADFPGDFRAREDKTLLQIRVPKGQKSLITNSNQEELVLPPNTRFRVTKRRRRILDQDMPGLDERREVFDHVYELEIVPDKPKPKQTEAEARRVAIAEAALELEDEPEMDDDIRAALAAISDEIEDEPEMDDDIREALREEEPPAKPKEKPVSQASSSERQMLAEAAEHKAKPRPKPKEKPKSEKPATEAPRAKLSQTEIREKNNQKRALERKIKTRRRNLTAANKAGRKGTAKKLRQELKQLRAELGQVDYDLSTDPDIEPPPERKKERVAPPVFDAENAQGIDLVGSGFKNTRHIEHADLADYRDDTQLSRGSNEYTGGAYNVVNSYLRAGNLDDFDQDDVINEKNIKKMIEEINADMKPLTQDLHLYRGDPDADASLEPGDVFSDKGFLSTSSWQSVGSSFAENEVMFQIAAPKGQKAIVMNFVEKEVLLPHGTKFRVKEKHTNVDMDTGLSEIFGEEMDENVKVLYVLEPIEEKKAVKKSVPPRLAKRFARAVVRLAAASL